MERKIGFIGAGNMGAALVKCISGSGITSRENIRVYDIDAKKAGKISEETGINVSASPSELVKESDVIILAVKPDVVENALRPCREHFNGEKILVSVAAGVSIKRYRDMLGHGVKIVRTMPNTPALIGEGMTVISFNDSITREEKDYIIKLFNCAGKTEVMDESLMNDVIALTASSPAYVFMFIEAMADAAVRSGIKRDAAYRMAAQALLGSAKLLLETGKHPGELKDQVCSPGGTTIEAVAALEKNGFRHAIFEAMKECSRKAREL